MICTSCKNEMIVLEYKQIELDYCSECRGVWFDNAELELLLHSLHLNGSDVALSSMMESAEIELPDKHRKCPICDKNMKLVDMGQQEQIVVDICRSGDGIWFDGGELEQLVRQKGIKSGTSAKLQGMFRYLGDVFQS